MNTLGFKIVFTVCMCAVYLVLHETRSKSDTLKVICILLRIHFNYNNPFNLLKGPIYFTALL